MQKFFLLYSFVSFLLGQSALDIFFIPKIVNQVYLNHYDSAKQYIREYKVKGKSEIMARAYGILWKQFYMKDMEDLNEKRSDSLLSAIEETIDILEDGNVTLKTYLIGHLYLVKAAEEQRQENNFTAFRDGYKALSYLEEAYKENTNLSSALFGAGIFKYWKSVHTKNVPIFFKDERKEALVEIEKSRDDKLLPYISYVQQKIYLLIEEKEIDKAYELNKEMLQKYPKARIFLWSFGHVLKYKKLYQEAFLSYKKLYLFYKERSVYNKYNTLKNIIECLYKDGRYQKAKEYFEKMPPVPSALEENTRLQGVLDKIEMLGKNIDKMREDDFK